MNAQEARKASLGVNSETAKKQTEEITSAIRSACERGEYSCVLFKRLLPGVVKNLIVDGFKVDQKEDNERGMSTTYYEISW